MDKRLEQLVRKDIQVETPGQIVAITKAIQKIDHEARWAGGYSGYSFGDNDEKEYPKDGGVIQILRDSRVLLWNHKSHEISFDEAMEILSEKEEEVKSPLGRVYIPVDTKDKWENLMRLLEAHPADYKWVNGGEKPTEYNNWKDYCDSNAIRLGYDDNSLNITYATKEYYEEGGVLLMPYEEAVRILKRDISKYQKGDRVSEGCMGTLLSCWTIWDEPLGLNPIIPNEDKKLREIPSIKVPEDMARKMYKTKNGFNILSSKLFKQFNNKTMLENFKQAFMKEPQKTFHKAGLVGDDNMLTGTGEVVLLNILFQDKDAQDKMLKVAKDVLEEGK